MPLQQSPDTTHPSAACISGSPSTQHRPRRSAVEVRCCARSPARECRRSLTLSRAGRHAVVGDGSSSSSTIGHRRLRLMPPLRSSVRGHSGGRGSPAREQRFDPIPVHIADRVPPHVSTLRSVGGGGTEQQILATRPSDRRGYRLQKSTGQSVSSVFFSTSTRRSKMRPLEPPPRPMALAAPSHTTGLPPSQRVRW